MFQFEINQEVEISISGERGYVKGLAQYADNANQVLVFYKDAHGKAVEFWFSESHLNAI